MHFDHNATILTSDGEKAGHLDRVVIDPRTREVSHLVIRKGLLNAKLKVVPMMLVSSAAHDEIGIRLSADRLDELENYEDTKYVPTNESDNPNDEAPPRDEPTTLAPAPSVYWYPPYLEAGVGAVPARPGYVREKQVNIPEDTVAIKEGAQVTTSDGKHVGKVQEILTSPKGGQITHFRISKGVMNRDVRLIPVEWVARMDPEELTLAVSEKTVEGLPSMEHAQ
jgi:sporulation protein YlmC with PRC-barrel domain